MSVRTARLQLVIPTGIPVLWTATVREWEGVEPFDSAVTLSMPEVDGTAPDLEIWIRPGLSEAEVNAVIDGAQHRLSRLFCPDGSEPDLWENQPGGRGLVSWSRIAYLPPLVTTEHHLGT